MTSEERINISNLAIQTYGVRQQLNHTIEELAELTVEVSKNIRGFQNRDKIIEEMADVLNCLQYLVIILDIDKAELDIMMNYKLRRTKKIIEELQGGK